MLNDRQKTEIRKKINQYFTKIAKSNSALDMLQEIIEGNTEFDRTKYNDKTIESSEALNALEKLFKIFHNPNPLFFSYLNISQYDTPSNQVNIGDVRTFLEGEIKTQIYEYSKKTPSDVQQISHGRADNINNVSTECSRLNLNTSSTNKMHDNSLESCNRQYLLENREKRQNQMFRFPTSNGGYVDIDGVAIGDFIVKSQEAINEVSQLRKDIEAEKLMRKEAEDNIKKASEEFEHNLKEVEQKSENACREANAKVDKVITAMEEERKINEENRQWRGRVMKSTGVIACGVALTCASGGANIPVQIGQALASEATPFVGGAVGYYVTKIIHDRIDPKVNYLNPFK